ncbi:MAG: hypothetical protein A3G75_03910 [Verrucomicrobia bacterium RIFCSPLOWO2_12_FULL_64_8]|nr:MAG: hypothetical protein A3G75_03910 [Verrucomicrobia bacterium RIFCSPLOWO2_12_FULL_64_8]
MPAPRYSLVVPFYQEAGNIRPLMEAACQVLAGLEGGFEALLVDDGSTDGTAEELAAVAAADPRCRVIRLEQNSGQAAALLRGLQQAQGEIILTMDGDGQNDPRDFPNLLSELERSAADVVCGWRVDRHDTPARRLMSAVANGVRRRMLRDGVHDSGCQLRVLRREVIGALIPRPMMQSFLPAMAAAAGFCVRELPVSHHPRRHGLSKYGVGKLWWRPCVELVVVWRLLRRVAAERSRR